jgi:hypothetical protein
VFLGQRVNVPNIIALGQRVIVIILEVTDFILRFRNILLVQKGAIVFTIMLTVIRINAHSYLLHVIYFQPAEEKYIHTVLHKL